MEITLSSINEISAAVSTILKQFPDNRLWLFYGPMGSGKTTIIKEFCRQLGVTEETSSPTFSIINEYKSLTHQRVYHSDLYRLKKQTEVVDTGLAEMINSAYHLFIEWPELAENILPAENVQVHLEVIDENVRKISAN